MSWSPDLRMTLLGFAAALGVLGVLFWFIGFGEILTELAPARLHVVALVLLVSIAWLFAWSLTLRIVLGGLDHPVSLLTGSLIFMAGQFANNVTPFGQAGGEPITALLISKTVDTEYETGLAAIASVDAINLFPSLALAVTGLAYYAIEFTFGPRLQQASVAVVAILVIAPAVGYICWRYREGVESAIVGTLTPVGRVVCRVIPGRSPPEPEMIRARVENFFRDLGRVASDRRLLLLAVLFSTAGWLCLVGSLWLSLAALGHQAPFAATLVIVPVSAIAGIAPLPGGLGVADSVLIVLLVSLTPVGPAAASATVVVHRLATYWLPIGLGGGSALALGSEIRRSTPG